MEELLITREKAIELLNSMPQQESDINHYLETEAIMRSLAKKFEEDIDYWGMIGLLHDVDWALTRNNWKEHLYISDEHSFDNFKELKKKIILKKPKSDLRIIVYVFKK